MLPVNRNLDISGSNHFMLGLAPKAWCIDEWCIWSNNLPVTDIGHWHMVCKKTLTQGIHSTESKPSWRMWRADTGREVINSVKWSARYPLSYKTRLHPVHGLSAFTTIVLAEFPAMAIVLSNEQDHICKIWCISAISNRTEYLQNCDSESFQYLFRPLKMAGKDQVLRQGRNLAMTWVGQL